MYAFLGEVHANALVLFSVATQLFNEKSVCTQGQYVRAKTEILARVTLMSTQAERSELKNLA